MTREEYEQYAIENGLVVWSKEMSERAIKALEQEPSGDLISRQAVIDACEQSINILEAVDRIMDLPSVEQEPKTGHWRPIYQGDEIIDYRCTECEFGNTFGKSTYRMNYCPNCGAKMEEGSDKE